MFYNRHLKILGLLYLRPPELAGPADAGGAPNCVVEVAGRRAVSSVGASEAAGGAQAVAAVASRRQGESERRAQICAVGSRSNGQNGDSRKKKRNPSLQTVARKA